jgi:hypothetical protein
MRLSKAVASSVPHDRIRALTTRGRSERSLTTASNSPELLDGARFTDYVILTPRWNHSSRQYDVVIGADGEV